MITDVNLFRLVKTCSNMIKLVQNCLKLSLAYLSKLVGTCWNLLELVGTCRNLFKLAQTCINIFFIGPNCTASGGVPTGIETSNAPMCVVTGCHFQYNPKSHRWKLYPLPKSEDMKDKWLEKINLPHNVPISDAVVCYKHFHEHDFVPRYKLSKRGHSKLSMGALKATAVPTLHLFSDPANPKVVLTNFCQIGKKGDSVKRSLELID